MQGARCAAWFYGIVMAIKIKTAEEIERLRVAGRLAAEVLDMIGAHVRAGVSTFELDRLCHDYVVDVQGTVPANVGYGAAKGRKAFPATICASVNNVICHGIPDRKALLRDGDVLNIDVTVIKDGWHGDTSRMYTVGETTAPAKHLIATTHRAMWAGIRAVKPGATLGDVGAAIQKVVESERFSVVREYCGHGIGRVYHEEPQVLHYGKPGSGVRLVRGMTFTIEPMVNAGKPDTYLSRKDGWTVVTTDGSLSAQWEHMVAVTDDGFDVLTISEGSPDRDGGPG